MGLTLTPINHRITPVRKQLLGRGFIFIWCIGIQPHVYGLNRGNEANCSSKALQGLADPMGDASNCVKIAVSHILFAGVIKMYHQLIFDTYPHIYFYVCPCIKRRCSLGSEFASEVRL